MARNSWHTLRENGAVVLTRRIPPHFDIKASAQISVPGGLSLTALASQVRQDTWRALRAVRGFSPVVRVERQDDTVTVTSGGHVPRSGNMALIEAKVQDVLDDPANRRRWLAHAGRKS